MINTYYIEFKTWAEGYVTIPWPWAKYEDIADYRLRSDLKVSASSGKIRSIFTNMDETSCNKFLREYVSAIAMGVIIDLEDQTSAIELIKSVFGYCELLGFCEITNGNQASIEKIMADARSKPSTAITVS